MRVLIVDDESSVRGVIAHKLEPLGYEVHQGKDGIEALELAERLKPEIILLDVNMPRLDGYQVLERLRSTEQGARTYVLMLTAMSQLEDVEKGLVSGADDYLTKPFDLRELLARVKAAARIQSLQQELLLKNSQLAHTNQALEFSLKKQESLNRKMLHELEVAARLQTSLLSPARIEMGRCLVSARYTPSSKIGGDFYDVRPLGTASASIFLADAAGHGVSAALLAAMLKIALEETLLTQTRPSAVLSELNRKFQFCADRGEYISAFYGVLESETGNLVYCVAGQVPPLLYRSSSDQIEVLNSPGFCLGIFDDGWYEDREIRLLSGDRLFLFTDGLSEATPDDEEQFGSRLPDLLRAGSSLSNEEFLDYLTAGLTAYLGAEQRADDCTLLSVHLLDGAGPANCAGSADRNEPAP